MMGPRDAMLLLRVILDFLGFATRKDERQSETRGRDEDQVPEKTELPVRQRRKEMQGSGRAWLPQDGAGYSDGNVA